ncbi:MAG: RNA-binding protein [Planctomycetota bacterium]|jgi:hypothetical protein
MAVSGRLAKVKVTAATPTSSTDEAFTKLSTGRYQITDYTKRIWDRNATGAPIFSIGGTPAAATETYSVNYVQGIVTFDPSSNTTGSVAVTADLHYLTASYLGQTRTWDVEVDTNMLDVTAFSTTVAAAQFRSMTPGLSGGNVTLGRFWSSGTTAPTFHDQQVLGTRFVVDLHGQNFERLTGFAYVETDGLSADIDGLDEESVTLRLDGPLYFSTSS